MLLIESGQPAKVILHTDPAGITEDAFASEPAGPWAGITEDAFAAEPAGPCHVNTVRHTGSYRWMLERESERVVPAGYIAGRSFDDHSLRKQPAGAEDTRWACRDASADRPCADRPTARTALRSKAPTFVPYKRTDGEQPDAEALSQTIERTKATTLMLHNIPKDYTRKMVIDMLDDLGMWPDYDFVYLPAKLETGLNFGYFFVNLTSPCAAKRLNEVYLLHCEAAFSSKLFCPATLCKIQGQPENIRRYQRSPIMSEKVPDEFKPVVFRFGMRVPFPLPDGAPREPRRTAPQKQKISESCDIEDGVKFLLGC